MAEKLVLVSIDDDHKHPANSAQWETYLAGLLCITYFSISAIQKGSLLYYQRLIEVVNYLQIVFLTILLTIFQ